MRTVLTPIDRYREKLYQREKDSNLFADLSEEQLEEISKKVCRKQEIMKESSQVKKNGLHKLDLCYKVMLYLTNPNTREELETFDEKMAFLIMMTDPNLIMYKEFLKTNIISLSEITNTASPKEKERLTNLRNQAISNFEFRVREQLGFYDAKMLKYEEAFFRKFFSEKELITEVDKDNQDDFMLRAKVLPDFSCISDKRYDELVAIAQGWLSLVPEKNNSKTATYSVLNQKKLLGLRNIAEQVAFFILVVDSNLDMLRIHEEESKIQNVQERIVNEFGYFSTDLIDLEKKFHNRFCPDKKLSIWTKTKKD